MRFTYFLWILYFMQHMSVYSQPHLPPKSSGEIQLALKHMLSLGSVLYIAAHPDDENNRLIAYYAKEKGYRTAYLSLTRGDGGQNLIGDEKGDLLGLLRTQELLAARRVDGGEQQFSRALDFGYSKNPEETLTIWNREQVLGDIVWAIRKFQPDIIVNRFAGPERGGGGHGHHTTSAILSREAFKLAADPTAYPEQLQYVSTWQAKRLFWNLYSWFRYEPSEEDKKRIITLNMEAYNPLLGKSIGELAAESRSMHRCQAFGSARQRGEQNERLLLLEGEWNPDDVMAGVETSWNRVNGGAEAEALLQKAYAAFEPEKPHEILPYLLEAYEKMNGRQGNWWEYKREKLKELIAYCSGLFFEATCKEISAALGDTVVVNVDAIKRSTANIRLARIKVIEADKEIEVNQALDEGKSVYNNTLTFALNKQQISQPYWLANPQFKGMYDIRDQLLIGTAENKAALQAEFEFVFEPVPGGKQISVPYTVPVLYKTVDRSIGEVYNSFIITPALTFDVSEQLLVFSDNTPKSIEVKVRSHSGRKIQGAVVNLSAPEGWTVSPNIHTLSPMLKGQEQVFSVEVKPVSQAGSGKLSLNAVWKGQNNGWIMRQVAYSHIPTQTLFEPAQVQNVRIDLKKENAKIAYLMGSGDEIPAALRRLGFTVDLLREEDMSLSLLNRYDAVIAGIRAYNTLPKIGVYHDMLMSYVEGGGTYIVQYNTGGDLKSKKLGPFDFGISRDRATVEDAPVSLLEPTHPIFNYPNKITPADFEGWVQERGLYFAEKWDARYKALLSCADPGDKETQGALIVAPYGKGTYIYTGLSFFRQLPEGVPGAYKLFVNMLATGRENTGK